MNQNKKEDGAKDERLEKGGGLWWWYATWGGIMTHQLKISGYCCHLSPRLKIWVKGDNTFKRALTKGGQIYFQNIQPFNKSKRPPFIGGGRGILGKT